MSFGKQIEYGPEEGEQVAFVCFLESLGLKYTAIPNSTYTKSWMQKKKNTDMGLRGGLPDLLIIVNDKLVFVEMKRQKGGVVSVKQKGWIEALNKCDGVSAYVCRGYNEAVNLINKLK